MTESDSYAKGRADEREAIIRWLEAEAAAEPIPSYAIGFSWAATLLKKFVPLVATGGNEYKAAMEAG